MIVQVIYHDDWSEGQDGFGWLLFHPNESIVNRYATLSDAINNAERMGFYYVVMSKGVTWQDALATFTEVAEV